VRSGLTLFLCSSDHPYNWEPAPSELAYLRALNIEVVNVSQTETPEHTTLLHSFKRNSGNGLAYERFCTLRFLSLQLILSRYSLKNAAMYDMDSTPMHNLFDAYGEDNW